MSQLVARILLALFVVPLGLVAYIVMMMAFTINRGYADRISGIVLTGSAAWGFVAVYWMLLWWRQIRWTPTRIGATLLTFPLAVLVSGVIGWIVAEGISERIAGYGFASVIAPLAWLMATILVWRETKAERAARVSVASTDAVTCPTCGYNLTGLSEPRCPECGARFTLDQLFTRQPHRESAKLEQEITE